jgi:hypothetical protein
MVKLVVALRRELCLPKLNRLVRKGYVDGFLGFGRSSGHRASPTSLLPFRAHGLGAFVTRGAGTRATSSEIASTSSFAQGAHRTA